MIKIPNVTLFGIDCFKPLRTIDAMQWSTRHVRFAEVVLLTDLRRHPNIPDGFNHGTTRVPIRVVNHVESDRKVPYPRAEHYPVAIDYELASLKEPSMHVHTSHLLYMEWDSAICNPWAWDESWLQYDYIGAPWAEHLEEGWLPCDGVTNNVGNGGFSLRSVRYSAATREMAEVFKNDPAIICSDSFPCINKRPWLEERGIKFAPEIVAARFSCEDFPYSGQFGAHGKWTFELNNWCGRFAGMRP